jgi:predicted metalloendopeptidase
MKHLPILLALAASVVFAQERNYTPMPLPTLEKFDASLLDASKNACTDFFQYTCSKWIAVHPIPSDLPRVSVGTPLGLYNETILRNAMDKASAPKATGRERQIGDFWQSCMDQVVRDANGREWLRPHLDAVAQLKSKKDLSRVLAYVHLNFPAAWQADDNFTQAPLFGFGPTQDFEDASKVVAFLDQGGMALPALAYYLDPSDHFKGLRAQYVEHMRKMFELAGDGGAKASDEATAVMQIETALAKGSMDNVTRRDPH